MSARPSGVRARRGKPSPWRRCPWGWRAGEVRERAQAVRAPVRAAPAAPARARPAPPASRTGRSAAAAAQTNTPPLHTNTRYYRQTAQRYAITNNVFP